MPNFVDCWNSLKAKGYKHADGSEVLNDQDRASIEARIQEHLRTGLDPIEAAKASVKSHLDEAHAQLQSIYDQVVPKTIPQGQVEQRPNFMEAFKKRWPEGQNWKLVDEDIGSPDFNKYVAILDKNGHTFDVVTREEFNKIGAKPVSGAGQAPAETTLPEQQISKTEGGTGEEVQKGQEGRQAVLATERVQPPAAPPETPEALGEALKEKPRLAGPSNRVLQERAAKGEIPQAPESGIGVLKEDLIKQANERYSPERSQLAAQKALRGESNLADEADIVLHEEQLTKAAADAERALKSNPTDLSLQQAYQSARNAMTDWQHGPIAAIKTAWANKGINLQGATDVDTGTLVGLQKLAWDTGKGDFTPEQSQIMDQAATRVTKAMAEEKASIVKANETVQKVLKPSRYMDLKELRDSLDATLKSMTC